MRAHPSRPPEGRVRAEPDGALADLRRRLLVCVLLTVPICILGMADELFGGAGGALGPRGRAWLQLALATPVVAWGAAHLFQRAARSLRTRLDMFTLIALGTAVAYGQGLVATIATLPEAARTSAGMASVFFQTATILTTLVLATQLLEARLRSHTRDDIRSLVERVDPSIGAHVSQAARSCASVQGHVERAIAYLIPLVLVVATATFLLWFLRGEPPDLARAFARTVAVLVIASPYALGMAVPMSVMTAMGTGARAGVLVKDARALETLSRVTTLVVDKTGSLTEGAPRVQIMEVVSGVVRADVLRLVAAAELASDHPLARAIVQHARSEQVVEELGAVRVEATRGAGITAVVEGKSVMVGTARHLAEHGVVVAEDAVRRADGLRAEGHTVSFAALEGRCVGMWAMRDAVKPTSKTAVRHLQELGVRVVMVTGDARASARSDGWELGLHEADVIADALPADKVKAVVELQRMGEVVAVATQAARDAPALARADVGITLGIDNEVALETTDVTLVKGDVGGIDHAIRLGRKAVHNIRENLALAAGYNVVAIPVATGALYAYGVVPSPVLAALVTSLSTAIVLLNALRLRSALGAEPQAR